MKKLQQGRGQLDSILFSRYLDWVRGRREVALSQTRVGHHLPVEDLRHESHPSETLCTEETRGIE